MACVILTTASGRHGRSSGPHRGIRGLASRGRALHAGARRGDHRGAGRGHRPGGPLVRAAALRRAPASSGAWASPSTSNGTANAHALLNLALVAGQLGKPGNGISPLRGQNNVQGCGDAGCIPTNLPGYQSYDAPSSRQFERAWGVRPPAEPGLVVTEMVEGCLDGRIRAMYVVGENPLLSEPDLHHAQKASPSSTSSWSRTSSSTRRRELAHVFLPGAPDSRRRKARSRTPSGGSSGCGEALHPPGEARPDWWITAELAQRVARRLGLAARRLRLRGRLGEICDEMAGLVPFVAGISHARLDREGGLQWPCPAPDHPGTRYLYARELLARPRAVRAGHPGRGGRGAAGPGVPVRR